MEGSVMIAVELVREARARNLAEELQEDWVRSRWNELEQAQQLRDWPPSPAHGDHQGFDVDRNDVDTDCPECNVEAQAYFDDLSLEQYMEDLYHGAER